MLEDPFGREASWPVSSLSGLPPIHPGAVDVDDLVGDPDAAAIVVDGLLATFELAVVVDDAEPTGRQFRVGALDRLDGRLVHIAIEAHHRQILDRRARQGVLEPTDQKLDLIVQETIASEVAFDLLDADSQLVGQVMLIACISAL